MRHGSRRTGSRQGAGAASGAPAMIRSPRMAGGPPKQRAGDERLRADLPAGRPGHAVSGGLRRRRARWLIPLVLTGVLVAIGVAAATWRTWRAIAHPRPAHVAIGAREPVEPPKPWPAVTSPPAIPAQPAMPASSMVAAARPRPAARRDQRIVEVRTEPAGAEVAVNGVVVGKSPVFVRVSTRSGGACTGGTCMGAPCIGDTCVGATCAGTQDIGTGMPMGGVCVGGSCTGGTCAGVPCTGEICPAGFRCTGGTCTGGTCTGGTCAGGACAGGTCPGGTCTGATCAGALCAGGLCEPVTEVHLRLGERTASYELGPTGPLLLGHHFD